MKACMSGFREQTRAVVDYIKRIPRLAEEVSSLQGKSPVLFRGIPRRSDQSLGGLSCFFWREDASGVHVGAHRYQVCSGVTSLHYLTQPGREAPWMSKLKLPGAKDFTPITQTVLVSRFHLGFVWTQICARLPVSSWAPSWGICCAHRS